MHGEDDQIVPIDVEARGTSTSVQRPARPRPNLYSHDDDVDGCEFVDDRIRLME